MDDQNRMEKLIEEVEALRSRVSDLEDIITQSDLISRQSLPPERKLSSRPSPEISSTPRTPMFRDGLENLIGKRLLNRVGIIILLCAMGYFLKYSFDNGWIGPLGQVVLGYMIGAIFLISGDLLIRKGYHYFAQGISGGGIAIIYLSTVAAVSLYNLLPAYTAFLILVLAALAGGLLANRQNALGLAFISTLGGFMAPFLVDSQSNSIAALLSYISILDLTVLYLAYYRNWRGLNILALLGTIMVYTTYSLVSASQPSIALQQAFLCLFFLIFGSLTFLYNVRRKLASGAGELVLLIINAGFFFAASYENLYSLYQPWLAWLAVVLALVYLLSSRWLIKNNPEDRLLFMVFLGTGLAFITIAIPLQFHQQWMVGAWLVEAGVLVYAGFRTGIPLVHRTGVLLLLLVSVDSAVSAPGFDFSFYPILNIHSLNSYLGIGGLGLGAYTFFAPTHPSRSSLAAGWILAVGSVLMALIYLDWEVGNALTYFRLDFSQSFSLSLVWVLLALIIFLWGLIGNLKVFRILALGLFIITTLKVLFFDLSYMDMVFRIIILTIVGLILVAVSFAYQQREKRKEKDEIS